jgi:hypothetical protein
MTGQPRPMRDPMAGAILVRGPESPHGGQERHERAPVASHRDPTNPLRQAANMSHKQWHDWVSPDIPYITGSGPAEHFGASARRAAFDTKVLPHSLRN